MHGNKSCSNLMAFSIHSLGLKEVPKVSEISASYTFAFVIAGARREAFARVGRKVHSKAYSNSDSGIDYGEQCSMIAKNWFKIVDRKKLTKARGR
jgi:hypothetical protein